MERMSGGDALMYFLDGPNTPMQTLKITVLDPAGLGREPTLDDLEAAFSARVTRYPRLRQKVHEVPLALGRPLWVDDPAFDLRSHLAEATLAEPTREEFDRLLSRLATDDLDYSRPLWDATLVRGMQHGHVAVAMRIHHCVTDGTSAATALHDLTSDTPNGPIAAPEVASPSPDPMPSQAEILREAARDRLERTASWPSLLRRSSEGAKRALEVTGDKPYLPRGNTVGPWTSLNLARVDRNRIAVTAQLPFDDFRTVSKAFSATVNDVLLTLVGTAFRLELDRRGERYDDPVMTSFGMAADTERHLWGNHITTVWTPLFVEKNDPVQRLRAISKAARELIAARRASGTERAAEWAEHTGPLFRFAFHKLIPHSPKVSTNIITANVKGPAERRWAGPCEVVDFYSFAVLQPTSGLNCTVYSYAGHMNIGLLSSPDQHDEPRRFIDDMGDTLGLLLKAAANR